MKRMVLCFLTVTTVLLLCGCAVQPPAATTLPTVTTSPTVPPTTTLPQIAEPFVPGRYIYWNRPDESEPLTLEDVGVGQLYIRDELSRAVEAFADEPDAVYAVSVLELTGASRQEIYEKYVRHLDKVHDEYLLRQVIFVNRQQLEAMKPHKDFAIVLKLRRGNNNRDIYLKWIDLPSYTYSREDVLALIENEIWGDPVRGTMSVAGADGPYQEGESWESKAEPIVQDILEYYHLEKESLWLGTTGSGQKCVYFSIAEKNLLDLWADERIQYLIIEDWGGEFYAAEDLECLCIDAFSSYAPLSQEIRAELEQAWEKSGGDPLIWEDSETNGIRYYGTHGDCIVLFAPGHLQGFRTENILGYEFEHGCSFTLYAYKDGQFLTLENAYENQWLSQEQIASIAEHHRGLYQKALDALEEGNHPVYLSKEKKVELQYALLKYSGATAQWYTDNLYQQTRYYGNHEGYDIILYSITPDTMTGSIEIGGRLFLHSNNFYLLAYQDGQFTPLVELYNAGLISVDSIAEIYQIHKPLQDIIFGSDMP